MHLTELKEFEQFQNMQQRSFPSGSRQAPDPFDQFLEQQGFYRKHTARDASSLFRVISEQMYDSQMHHLSIRKKCVKYMRKHRKFFGNLIERDFDEYLDDMSKPKTFATLIELQAVGLLYQRNVLLFEPFNLGNYFGYHRSYFVKVFRVFCTPEKHFDTVYTSSYIKDAAICQSLCYELLYKDLFKLPDVSYAVELMLHNGSIEPQQNSIETNEDGYDVRIEMADKRSFDLDLPTNTNCILEDSKLCRFHCSEDITNDENKQIVPTKLPMEILLPHKHISCVRQLLLEGITPFPYKVAKALDPTMYRNIEFDAWNEARKELKLLNWYCGDGNFKIGAKCHVKLPKTDNQLYLCHVQDISIDRTHCLVFIEQLGEKRLVPYDALSPLPIEQFKPWALPYRFHRQLEKCDPMRLSRHYNYHFKLTGQSAHTAAVRNYCKTYCGGMSKAIYNLTHLENFQARTFEYCTMPLTVEHNVNFKYALESDGCNDDTLRDDSSAAQDTTVEATDDLTQVTQTVEGVAPESSPASYEVAVDNPMFSLEQSNGNYIPEYAAVHPVQPFIGVPENFYGYGCESGVHQQFGNCGNGVLYFGNPAGPGPSHAYSPAAENFYFQTLPPPLIISPTSVQPQQYFTTNNAFYASSTSAAVMPTAPLLNPGSSMTHTIQDNGNSSVVHITTPLSGRINYDAKKSFKLNGMDLPTDMATLRYFYNLGVESHNRRRHSHDSATGNRDIVKDERHGSKDNIMNKSDANNNCISTNVHSKPNSSNSSSGYQAGGNKQPYGPPRRFQSRYGNNYRDRQPQRRNSVNEEACSSSLGMSNNSYGHRNYDYSKTKQQNQHGNNDRHYTESNRPNSTPNPSHTNHTRCFSRNAYYDNMGGHAVSSVINGENVYETGTGMSKEAGDHSENAQMYSTNGPPPNFEVVHDVNNAGGAMPPTPMGPNGTTVPNNILIPVHVPQPQAPYGAMYSAPVLQPIHQPNQNLNSNSTNYVQPQYFGYPPPSAILQNGFNAPLVNGSGSNGSSGNGFYTPSNALSSNASESSAGNQECNGVQPNGNYGNAVPIYMAPNGGNTSGQPIMHHALQPPPPPPPHMISGGPQGFWCMPQQVGPPPPALPPSNNHLTHTLPANVNYFNGAPNGGNNSQMSTCVSPNSNGVSKNKKPQKLQQQQQHKQKPQQSNEKEITSHLTT